MGSFTVIVSDPDASYEDELSRIETQVARRAAPDEVADGMEHVRVALRAIADQVRAVRQAGGAIAVMKEIRVGKNIVRIDTRPDNLWRRLLRRVFSKS